MKKYKTIKLPYDKQHEKEAREDFYLDGWLEDIPLDIDFIDSWDSDNWKGVNEIESEIDIKYALERLTKRQQEIVELKIEGYNLIEISKKLTISIRTIKREMALSKQKCAILL